MKPLPRPLAGCAVGLSISESDDSMQRGFPAWQVNRVTLQVVSAIFGQGGGVVFGHDWREDGVMETVHAFARQMQSPGPVSPEDGAGDSGQPLLRNLLPWPDVPRLSRDDLEQLSSTLRVEEAGLPEDLLPHEALAQASSANSPLRTYCRARGLTHLRHRLDEFAHARFCLGGRRGGSQGRYPGVIEEALLAVEKKKPLYLAGFLGGATRQVIDALEGKTMPEDFCAPTKVTALYDAPPVSPPEGNSATDSDRRIDSKQVWSTFQETGLAGLSEHNRLSESENAELFRTPVLERAIQLVLAGLSRLD